MPSTLILDPRGVQLEFQDAKDVNSVVRFICQQLASDSPARVSQLFTELVHSLRKASPKEVKTAWNNLRGKKICPEATKTEKLFLDALPQAGSTGTISLMAEILKVLKERTLTVNSYYFQNDIDLIGKQIEQPSGSRLVPVSSSVQVRRHRCHQGCFGKN